MVDFLIDIDFDLSKVPELKNFLRAFQSTPQKKGVDTIAQRGKFRRLLQNFDTFAQGGIYKTGLCDIMVR
jgi:hypothetical protein